MLGDCKPVSFSWDQPAGLVPLRGNKDHHVILMLHIYATPVLRTSQKQINKKHKINIGIVKEKNYFMVSLSVKLSVKYLLKFCGVFFPIWNNLLVSQSDSHNILISPV